MPIGKVSLRGIFFEDRLLAFNISGVVTTDDVGKGVALDTGAANTVKLAGVNDRIIGRLETVEARTVEGVTVGTVAVHFCDSMPWDGVNAFVVGDTAVGGNAAGKVAPKGGGVKAPDANENLVVEVLANGDPVVLKVGM